MDALLQGAEVESVGSRHDDFTVDHDLVRQAILKSGDELGKVALERFVIPAGDVNRVLVPEDDGPKAVPLRFVDPLGACRDVGL